MTPYPPPQPACNPQTATSTPLPTPHNHQKTIKIYYTTKLIWTYFHYEFNCDAIEMQNGPRVEDKNPKCCLLWWIGNFQRGWWGIRCVRVGGFLVVWVERFECVGEIFKCVSEIFECICEGFDVFVGKLKGWWSR